MFLIPSIQVLCQFIYMPSGLKVEEATRQIIDYLENCRIEPSRSPLWISYPTYAWKRMTCCRWWLSDEHSINLWWKIATHYTGFDFEVHLVFLYCKLLFDKPLTNLDLSRIGLKRLPITTSHNQTLKTTFLLNIYIKAWSKFFNSTILMQPLAHFTLIVLEFEIYIGLHKLLILLHFSFVSVICMADGSHNPTQLVKCRVIFVVEFINWVSWSK